MSRTVSPSSNRPYGVAPVVAAWNLARSSFYAARQRQQQQREEPQKRGPKVRSDEAHPIDPLIAEKPTRIRCSGAEQGADAKTISTTRTTDVSLLVNDS